MNKHYHIDTFQIIFKSLISLISIRKNTPVQLAAMWSPSGQAAPQTFVPHGLWETWVILSGNNIGQKVAGGEKRMKTILLYFIILTLSSDSSAWRHFPWRSCEEIFFVTRTTSALRLFDAEILRANNLKHTNVPRGPFRRSFMTEIREWENIGRIL